MTFFEKHTKLFDINHSATLICAATGACMVWKPGFTALGTTGQSRGRDLLMSPPFVPSRF